MQTQKLRDDGAWRRPAQDLSLFPKALVMPAFAMECWSILADVSEPPLRIAAATRELPHHANHAKLDIQFRPGEWQGGPDQYISAQAMQQLMHGKMIMKFELIKTEQGLLTEARIFLSDGSLVVISAGNSDQCNMEFWNKGEDPAIYNAVLRGAG